VELAYKEDTEQAQERLLAYWANECVDRPAISVSAPRDEPLPGPSPPPPAETVEQLWTDIEYRIACGDAELRATFHGGEAIPNFWPNFGPGLVATLFGSQPTFQEATVWFGPVEADWQSYHIRCDPTRPEWELAKRLTREGQAAFAGKALVGITDLGGGTDALDSLRDTPQLLMDLTNPELRTPICRARDLILRKWQECYEELYQLVGGPELGSIQWAGIWGPGRMYTTQSDMSCMISPEMFNWFVASEVEALCDFLDQCIYHLDGPAALRHLDRLLAIPSLQAIQWVPGAGEPSAVAWIPVLQQIQAAGKGLQVHEDPANVERLVRELKPEGLLICTSTETEQQARDLLRLSLRWCRAR